MQQIILFLYNYTQFYDRFIIILLEMSDNLHVVTVIYTYVQCAYINTLINIYIYIYALCVSVLMVQYIAHTYIVIIIYLI